MPRPTQPVRLRCVRLERHAGSRSRVCEELDRQVDRDVLATRVVERRTTSAVAAVRAEPPTYTSLQQLGGGRRVVEHDQRAVAQDLAALLEPVARGQGNWEARADRHRFLPHLPRRQGRRHLELGGGGHRDLREAAVLRRDPHLGPTVHRALDHAERQVVEQLVGEHDSRARHRRQVRERGRDRPDTGGGRPSQLVPRIVVGIVWHRPQRVLPRLEHEELPLGFAELGRPFDQYVAQRGRGLGTRGEEIGGQAAPARAGLDHDERIRSFEIAPDPIDRAGNECPEQRTDLGARDEVAARASGPVPASKKPPGP